MRVRPWLCFDLAGLLMVCLDLIIDPGSARTIGFGALLLSEWQPLLWSDVANFMGWFIVCLLILRVYIFLRRSCSTPIQLRHDRLSFHPPKLIIPAVLYFAVYLFNLVIAFSIRASAQCRHHDPPALAAVVVVAALKSRHFTAGLTGQMDRPIQASVSLRIEHRTQSAYIQLRSNRRVLRSGGISV
jgi:hypothetical protein